MRDFAKVFLQAGEEKRVEFVLNARAFACYDVDAKAWVVPQGNYQILLGASSRDIRVQKQVMVHGTPRTAPPHPAGGLVCPAVGEGHQC